VALLVLILIFLLFKILVLGGPHVHYQPPCLP
jgi:hypothetical protein